MSWSGTDPEGRRRYLGALLLAYYDPDGRLVYAGRAGTGINTAELDRLWQELQPLATDKMPLEVPPPRGSRFGSPLVLSRVHWVRPDAARAIAEPRLCQPDRLDGNREHLCVDRRGGADGVVKQARLVSSVLVGCLVLMLGTLEPSEGRATCGEECDGQYSSAIDDCRSQYGDDPADADDLTKCIREAKDDYRSCLDDCAAAMISRPHWPALLAAASEHRSREVTREFQREHACPSTGLTTGACPGYWRDNIVPLACGGSDAVWNMQWQTVRYAKAKDRWERRECGR